MKKRKRGNGILDGPSVGRIYHHSEVPGGRDFMAELAADGKKIVIHHNNGSGDTNIGFTEMVDFVVPSECGMAINCLFKTGGSVPMDTLSGNPWAGGKPIRWVL